MQGKELPFLYIKTKSTKASQNLESKKNTNGLARLNEKNTDAIKRYK